MYQKDLKWTPFIQNIFPSIIPKFLIPSLFLEIFYSLFIIQDQFQKETSSKTKKFAQLNKCLYEWLKKAISLDK